MSRKPRAPQTPTSNLSLADPTTAFALDVVEGRIVAGEHVRAAAARHLRDLKEQGKRGLVWRPEKAIHAIDFFPALLTVTAGAMEGKPFSLLPWHVFVVGSLFGWHKASGRLRFRIAWLETGKGQAKSPVMAAIGLYLMGWRGIQRAEIYAIAWDKDQANVLFKDAVAMCRATIPGHDDGESLATLEKVVLRGTLDNCWKIEHPESSSKFQSLANGENISGPRPTAVLADEIHEFKSGDPIELWRRAITKMPGDAFMVLGTNTPASNQIVGTSYSDYFQRIVTDEAPNDEAFAFIARVDKEDREGVFENEACWQKALPALGITFPVENIRGEVSMARQLLSTALSVKRLYFGIPIGTSGFWIDEEAWFSVQGKIDEAAIKGRPCWLSLDLSKKNDLTALSAAWEHEDGRLSARTWYWTTKDRLHDRARADNAPYPLWVEEGFLNAVPGAVIDKTFVAAKVAELCSANDVQFLAFDPAGMAEFIEACQQIAFPVWRWEGPDEPQGVGLKLVAHGQGKRRVYEEKQLTMPTSIEKLEDAILNGRITIEASKVTDMCASNAFVDHDGQNNRCFDKKQSRGRIDGLVTIAMATGAALMNEKVGPDMSGFLLAPLVA